MLDFRRISNKFGIFSLIETIQMLGNSFVLLPEVGRKLSANKVFVISVFINLVMKFYERKHYFLL